MTDFFEKLQKKKFFSVFFKIPLDFSAKWVYKYLQFNRIRTRLLNFCPASRGLRHSKYRLTRSIHWLNFCPASRGLRLTVGNGNYSLSGLNFCPASRGLRLVTVITATEPDRVELLPRFKGIATGFSPGSAWRTPC